MHGKKNNGLGPAADFALGLRQPQPAARRAQPAPREPQPAARASAAGPRDRPATARERVAAALADAASAQLKLVEEKPGFDPYNSGSFDRKHSWARTHRR
jgi:hypothetical protein